MRGLRYQIASSSSFWSSRSSLGVAPCCGGTKIAQTCGNGVAKELLYRKKVKADEAKDIGLVNKVVEHDELMNKPKPNEAYFKNAPIAVKSCKYGQQGNGNEPCRWACLRSRSQRNVS